MRVRLDWLNRPIGNGQRPAVRWGARLAVVLGVCLYWLGSTVVAPVEESWSDTPELVDVSQVEVAPWLEVDGDRCNAGLVDVEVRDQSKRRVGAGQVTPAPDGTWTARIELIRALGSDVVTVHATCHASVARAYSVGSIRLA